MKKLFPVRTIFLAASLLLQLGALCYQSRGTAGDVDLSFDPGSGVNGTVKAVVVQPDGKLIVGGDFTTVKGLARTTIARLNADGSADATFNAGTNISYLTSLALQPDGKVLVGHDNSLSRLNSDGSTDTGFSAILGHIGDGEGGSYSAVNSIVAQPDGRILIGGYFLTTSATTVNAGIARLNADGSVDASFDAGTANAGVYSLALQPDGKVLIGGFLNVSNATLSSVARLNANGSVDNTFSPAEAGFVVSLAVQSDGMVIFGGSFSSVNGTNRRGLARLHANGTLDSSFHPDLGSDDNWARSIALQTDGKVLVGGYFSVVSGSNRAGIALLNANGSLDASFDPGAGIGGTGNDEVNSVLVQSNGTVLIGGSFTRVNGTSRNRLARLTANGSLDGSFNPGTGVNGDVAALLAQPDGRILVGGGFSTVNDFIRPGIARLSPNGGGDSNFISPSLLGLYRVDRLASQADGKVLIAGQFSMPNTRGLARLNADGSVDAGFQPDIGAISSGYESVVPTVIAPQVDGKAFIGGFTFHYECDFETCVETIIPFLNRLNADGSRDTNFNSSIDFINTQGPTAVAVQPDGKVLVAGYFLTAQGTSRSGIARLNPNGSLDTSFDASVGIGGIAYSLALLADGRVLIGGAITAVNGTNRFGIARLNANGSLDPAFDPGAWVDGSVARVVSQPDGKVIIVTGANHSRIVRLNAEGGLDSSFNSGTGADGRVRAIALQPDGNVLIGGDFTTVNGVVRPHVARLYGDSVAPSLNIARSNASVIVSWPVSGLSFQLQESPDLSLPNSWSPVAQSAATNGNQIAVDLPTTTGSKFFRLQSQ